MTKLCPCGSRLIFMKCCKPFISGKKLPETAEQLMRSRYSAFTRGRADYIAATQSGLGAENFNEVETKSWAQSVKWLKLEVMESTENTVHFIAHFIENGQPNTIEENSQFEKIDGKWFYILS